ncbi:MAG TPA: DUF349 domain-containing protein [Tenuifilaceae bacterium]|nr:DUF349 domain-containing protein [Tenuifilaceae bacterium]HPE18019.1 DUF349 domain-containing protein [Tenuifilaceae bacterium]HPJ44619.1 DUF349 domain-containing protein [Tenuifilaceae bacterium]HPQ33979.1 DUF349 domain-containing protein [Tenuifilaceae bacterium]HRX68526.1 DUF349 domain-containing protein [Tenuifilaceae bacterium]
MELKDQKDQIKNDQFGEAESTPVAPEKPIEKTEEQSVEEKSVQSESNETLKAEEENDTPKSQSTNEKMDVTETIDDEEEEEIHPIDLDDETSTDDEEEDEDEDEDEETTEDPSYQPADYSALNREELVASLRKLLDERPVQKIRAEVESIKVNFYKKHKAEFERKRKEWVEAGGDIQQFEAPEDNVEPEIKELLKEYRELKAKYNRNLEDQKVDNLEQKQAIIEQIKELVNRNESVNQTFQDFRDLQQRWRDIGPVPQASLNDLWETYHHHVQNFYDYIKINKELRDLDLKKNMEEKIKLCEKAEELLLEPSIVNAFKKLQKYHNQWREIGPVPNEFRAEIWERFKDATSKINKKHQEYFEGLREEQKSNLEAKVALCEKAEELAGTVISSNKEWNKRSKEMIELQKVWKTIGFAPKKDNNRIYERFRSACDTFFGNKREFYDEAREEQQNNLQLKTELCMQAEALKESNEWKKTSEELINLQKRWKEIGPVPRKHSDDIWKRFRSACDFFFERKSKHFSQVDNKYEVNLKAKEDLIVEVETFKPAENIEENLKVLKDYQRRWSEIGFVPIKKKDEVQKRFREAINKHFEELKIDDTKKNILKFKTKIDTIQGNPRQENKMRVERDRLFNQLKQLENDITLWENNIGFFAKSKNAEQLIKDVERKIEKGRKDLKVLEEKIKLIDSMEQKQ